VRVFEKSRGFGGRMATRIRGDYQFDHGAQYFTAKSNEFLDFLRPYIDEHKVSIWKPTIASIDRAGTSMSDVAELYVSSPKMSSFCRQVASGVDVRLEVTVNRVIKKGLKWHLYHDDKFLGEFDWVICTAPSHQVGDLMPECFSALDEIKKIKMQGCYTLMLGFESLPSIAWDAAKVNEYDISWVAINSSKPQRDTAVSILAHSTNEWAEENIEVEPQETQKYLIEELSDILDFDVSAANHIDLHRWRYANVHPQSSQKAFMDKENQLAACGDWCIEGRVEAAFLSAHYLVECMKKILR
jgi:predicted NAD/FAD-dependent oxidoreductase